MPSRRAFLIGCGGAVAAPAFAHLGLSPAVGGSPTLLAANNVENLALRIDGWDAPADAGTDVWVQINSSWRATWR